jgi:hypothetical protein
VPPDARPKLQAPTPRGKETCPSKLVLRKQRNEVHLEEALYHVGFWPTLLVLIRCPVTLDEYEKLPLEEKNISWSAQNVARYFDRRSLDAVLFHIDHKHRTDIQYSGSEKLD